MRIPLHGNGTTLDIMMLHVHMAQLNPKGFRQPSAKKKNKKKTRMERLGALLK